MNTYNVYQGDKLVLERALSSDVTTLTGLARNRIGQYITKGKAYHGKTGGYTFEFTDEELDKFPDPLFEEAWDKERLRLNPKARRA